MGGSLGHQNLTTLLEWLPDSSGGVYVVGNTDGEFPRVRQEEGDQDAFIRKYNANGDEEWARQFGTSEFDFALGVSVDPSSGVYVVGISRWRIPWSDK